MKPTPIEAAPAAHARGKWWVTARLGRLAEVERLCRECVALCLGNWARLPPTPGSAAHGAHLATFSRLVEAQESAAMLQRTMRCARVKAAPDFRRDIGKQSFMTRCVCRTM